MTECPRCGVVMNNWFSFAGGVITCIDCLTPEENRILNRNHAEARRRLWALDLHTLEHHCMQVEQSQSQTQEAET